MEKKKFDRPQIAVHPLPSQQILDGSIAVGGNGTSTDYTLAKPVGSTQSGSNLQLEF